ncbi:4'-phosphopantetheinyl transferase superfamily protein [Actinoplanes sp. NEAU-A12]|uniref:4'-phosphopantetheinyl transferase superfamily protein n=1 Tax=Actinoplanes sandaracinus TaxID=3045177 RepID=A0ABT6WZN0_9ACTN|nr:4'-phosphopantetheinyl transferase superfamily protein [Actinoplanes sandaracinus]
MPDEPLFEAEEAALRHAGAQRRREFATVRGCARTALGRLGIAPVPIVPGIRGAPGWPAGVVGSMTHCGGYRAAAVARATDLVTLGIDAEPHRPLPDAVRARITVAKERIWLARAAAEQPRIQWDRLLFSAKEAVYKAWFPLTGRWLGFHEAALSIDPAGTFHAELLVAGPVREFAGRWLVHGDLVYTAIAVHRSRNAACSAMVFGGTVRKQPTSSDCHPPTSAPPTTDASNAMPTGQPR